MKVNRLCRSDNRKSKIYPRALGLALLLFLVTAGVVLAATIVIDGQFDDWVGQKNVGDPPGEVPKRIDILTFYWGTNPGVSTLYFMVQRDYPGGLGNQPVYYRIFINTDCDGSYTETSDRYLIISYDPTPSAGPTTVEVFPGNGGSRIAIYAGNWGDPRGDPPTGGTRTEFGVPFSDLGINPNQQICFYLGSYQNYTDARDGDDPNDRVPASGDINDNPVPALGYPLLALVVIGAIIVVWRRRGRSSWRVG